MVRFLRNFWKWIFDFKKIHNSTEINKISCRIKHLAQITLVSKALWYRTFKKIDCSLIWNFNRMYQTIHSSNLSKFHEKINGQFFARGQNVLYNASSIEVIAPSIMPLSIDLHVKCPFYKKWNKKKTPIFFFFFFSWNFHTVFREQIAIFYQIFKSGSSKNFFKCPQFTKV